MSRRHRASTGASSSARDAPGLHSEWSREPHRRSGRTLIGVPAGHREDVVQSERPTTVDVESDDSRIHVGSSSCRARMRAQGRRIAHHRRVPGRMRVAAVQNHQTWPAGVLNAPKKARRPNTITLMHGSSGAPGQSAMPPKIEETRGCGGRGIGQRKLPGRRS